MALSRDQRVAGLAEDNATGLEEDIAFRLVIVRTATPKQQFTLSSLYSSACGDAEDTLSCIIA